MPNETVTAAALTPEAEAFYTECLETLSRSGIPFLVGGTFAVCAHTGIRREAKDLDIFCKPGDYPRILTHFRDLGYQVEVEDERWIAKIRRDDHYVDVIFNSAMALMPITDQWFEEAGRAVIFGQQVAIVGPTELIWSKIFVQDRYRYDGADVTHVILRQCENIDWRRLLSHMDQYWEVLFGQLMNFRFIYPTERHRLPRWLLDELIGRLVRSLDLPVPQTKICRGRLFSRHDYVHDISQWGFADVGGPGERSDG